MTISIEETKELSKLCKLEFTEEDLANIKNQINNILVEVKNIEELEESEDSCPPSKTRQLRTDEVIKTLDKNDVFLNATENKERFFAVLKG